MLTSKLSHTKVFIYLFLPLLLLLLFVSCSGKDKAQKFEYAGGTFKFAIANEPSTFIVRDAVDFYSSTMMNQIYEGLVAFNPATLETEPCLAKSWDISEDGKTIHFHLRDDVYFHPHKDFPEGIKFTPEDVIYNIMLACSPMDNKPTYAYSSIYKETLKGAKAFYNKETDHIEGLSVTGNTVTFELLVRDINFIDKLAQTQAKIVSKKIVESGLETDLIGTGPFRFSAYTEVDGEMNIVLVKNNNYYQKDENGNQLPYLDSLVFLIENDNKKLLEKFEKEEILLLDQLTTHEITTLLSEGRIEYFNSTPPKLILDRKPLLATQYYVFNLNEEIFQNILVRKAINYAIDREDIVKNILHNQAYSHGNAGIVPPDAFGGYNTELVRTSSYSYNPQKARRLFAQAGFPNGEGFPSISIKYNIHPIHAEVANEIASQLKKVLNINVSLDGMPFQDLLEEQKRGIGQISKKSWYADFYSPENFLMNKFSKSNTEGNTIVSHSNSSGYYNPKFDELLEKARSTTDIIERFNYFAQAEKILMEDAPIIVLWYEETIKVVYAKVRNLELNEIDLFSFKNVYLKDWTKNEWEHRSQ